MAIPSSPRREAFFAKLVANIAVCPVSGCWEWQGGDSGDGRGGGYGRVRFEGQMVAPHRAMYVLVHGYVHRWQQVDHTCTNRRCICPDHLEAVTHKVNQARRDQRRAEQERTVVSIQEH